MQPAKGGRTELTSDMIVVGEKGVSQRDTTLSVSITPPPRIPPGSSRPQTRGMASDRKGRKRSDYGYLLTYRTRWFVVPADRAVLQGGLNLPIQERQRPIFTYE